MEHLPKALNLVNTRFDDVPNFQSYRLVNGDQLYENYVSIHLAEIVELVRVQMHYNAFNVADGIFFFNLLLTFNLTRDSNE